MANKKEYELAKAVSTYIKLAYPKAMFHFDLAGLNLSRTQAGMTKAIQGKRGFPDLFIVQPNNQHHGLFIELKIETPFKKDGTIRTNGHLEEQQEMLIELNKKGYSAHFSWGFDMTKSIIDTYLK